jgi:membrane protease YdiL (CAAX protease family)
VTDVAARAAPISAKRAYTETLLVFLAFFGSGVMGAAFYLAVPKETQPHAGWSGYLPASFDALAQIGLAVAVVLLLLHRRGLGRRDLGLSVTRPDGTRLAFGPTIRVVALAELALTVGSVVTGSFGGKYPGLNSSASYLFYMGASSFEAGVVEELVVLAFVVTTLRQARRPWWEVGTVAVVLRASYHVYYGAGATGVLIWAAAFFWLYARTRNLPALMAVHVCWDLAVFLSEAWKGVIFIEFALVGLVLLVAPITWLVDYTSRQRMSPAQHYPPAGWPQVPAYRWPPAPVPGWPGASGWSAWSAAPGDRSAPVWPASGLSHIGGPGQGGPLPPAAWYPDPSGRHRWRWWTGQEWTDQVNDAVT